MNLLSLMQIHTSTDLNGLLNAKDISAGCTQFDLYYHSQAVFVIVLPRRPAHNDTARTPGQDRATFELSVVADKSTKHAGLCCGKVSSCMCKYMFANVLHAVWRVEKVCMGMRGAWGEVPRQSW